MKYLLISLLLLFSACTPPQKVSAPQPIQNVIIIVGDDHAANVLGCYGNPIVRTPNLDRLAAKGVRFTHAYANSPMCSASRQSLLTGRYPHATGVTLLRSPFPEEQVTLADHLTDQGFVSAIIGKHHFNNDLLHGFGQRIERKDWQKYVNEHPTQAVPEGIEVRPKWRPFQDSAHIWLNADALPGGYFDEDMPGTWYADQAISFLNTHQKDRFCLWIGFHEPHSPFNFPIEDQGKYSPQAMPLPPISEEDEQWLPAVFRGLTQTEKQGIISAYYTSVEHLDKNVGLILDELDRLDLAEETLVVYLGDHGYLLGHHNRFEKHMMWEEAIRAPLILRGGQLGSNGHVEDRLVEFIDVVPTIVEVLRLEPMPSVQGKSLLPILTRKQDTHKTSVFAEFLVDHKAMIRTNSWKYIFTTGDRDLGQGYATGLGPPGLTHRLYDLLSDPSEQKDVSIYPEQAEVLVKLQTEMLQVFLKTHPKADSLPLNLTIEEQLSWFCIPPEGEQLSGNK